MEVNNFTKVRIDSVFLEKIAEKVLSEEKQDCTELSVSLVSPAEIKKLNKKYRKIDKPTDVLSFAFKDSGLPAVALAEAGEIVLCPQVVKENAEKYGESFKKEIARVLIHGVLHILGYDHKKGGREAEKMEKKTNYYINLCLRGI